MKRFIKQIFIVWRRGRGNRRIKVGRILRNQTDGVRFMYIQEGVKEALEQGFGMYPDFPNPDTIYRDNVLDIFSQRLTNNERSDIQKYYDYWEIDPELKDNKYYVLAQTQGLLPSDTFEFIAEYYPVRNLKFTSEICGLTKRRLKPGVLVEGDILRWELEPNNPYDKYAVRLFKKDKELGYVKAIHCNVFHKSKYKQFEVKVKSIEQNGYISRVFISIKTINK